VTKIELVAHAKAKRQRGSGVLSPRRRFGVVSPSPVADSIFVLCQGLIPGLSATGAASADDAGVGTSRALAETVAP
jgi:hypothetical protein